MCVCVCVCVCVCATAHVRVCVCEKERDAVQFLLVYVLCIWIQSYFSELNTAACSVLIHCCPLCSVFFGVLLLFCNGLFFFNLKKKNVL